MERGREAGGGEAGNLHRRAGKEGYQLLVLVLNIGPGHRWALRMQGEQGREVGAQIIVQLALVEDVPGVLHQPGPSSRLAGGTGPLLRRAAPSKRSLSSRPQWTPERSSASASRCCRSRTSTAYAGSPYSLGE